MAVVMIGIDPHKASHTAVAISGAEEPLGELRVRASAAQAGRLAADGDVGRGRHDHPGGGASGRADDHRPGGPGPGCAAGRGSASRLGR